MRPAASKLGSLEQVAMRVAAARLQGSSVALANGCFDLLHVGHVRYLRGARAEADLLVVAVNADESVRRIKGPGRPVQPEAERALLVAALRTVDHVLVFREDDVGRVLLALRPDVHCKGTDYTPESVPEREVVRSYGGRIAIVGDAKQHDTKALLARIRGLKALIVRLSSIGDVVHTLPALASLRRHGWSAGWLVEPPARPLLEGNPALAQLACAPSARGFSLTAAQAALGQLRAQRYDAALDFQGLWKSAAWARLSGAARVVGHAGPYRREPASALLLRERAEQPAEARHVIDKNLALLRSLGVEAVGSRDFPLPPLGREQEGVDAQLAARGAGRFALLNPGGGWASKLWPPESFGRLARLLRERGLAVLVSWGPGEQALADGVAEASGGAAERCFPTTLREYAALARRAALVVAADTGPLHLACALGVPAVGLYGPTDPLRNGPWSAADVVVRRSPPCAPCHRRVCGRHAGVMASIPVEEVAQAVERRLAATEPRGASPAR